MFTGKAIEDSSNHQRVINLGGVERWCIQVDDHNHAVKTATPSDLRSKNRFFVKQGVQLTLFEVRLRPKAEDRKGFDLSCHDSCAVCIERSLPRGSSEALISIRCEFHVR